jgi:hypothetical protein
MQRSSSPAGGRKSDRQRRAGKLSHQHTDADHKGGRPRRKAVQENKAAKDTDTDPLVKLELAVGLLDRGLLSVREYELLKQHVLTALLSTELGWPTAAQDRGSLQQCCTQSRRPWSQLLWWNRRSTATRLLGVQGVSQPSLREWSLAPKLPDIVERIRNLAHSGFLQLLSRGTCPTVGLACRPNPRPAPSLPPQPAPGHSNRVRYRAGGCVRGAPVSDASPRPHSPG